ncbi:MAG: TIGR02996 domain-containing protein [Kofleriaceae bacterium]
MARFERGDEFVEVWTERPVRTDGEYAWPQLRQRSGRIGQPAEPVALATRHAFTAERDYVAEQEKLLQSGWLRVADPDHDQVVPDEPSDPSLDAQLRADPGDREVALIYADWLQQREHPRGKLIAIQAARRDRADEAELIEAETALLDAHADAFLGPLADFVAVGDDPPQIALAWDLGFVERARIIGRFDEPADLLWDVLRHPSCRFLRELVIGCVRSGDQDNTALAATILHMDPKPPLRRLVLADFDDSELDTIDISRAPIGELRGLGAAYPDLEHVILKGTGDVVLADLALPRAKQFALRTSTMRKATLAAILAAPWPALEDLELWFGEVERGYGAECDVADLAPLFKRRWPHLRALRIMNSPFSDEIVAAIAGWAEAAQLTTLDFSLGTLSDAGARELVQHRAAFPRLERLGVFECALSPAGLALLRDAGFPVDATAISPAENWREPQQKTYRYCSVSE